jgi:hypothetical protein
MNNSQKNLLPPGTTRQQPFDWYLRARQKQQQQRQQTHHNHKSLSLFKPQLKTPKEKHPIHIPTRHGHSYLPANSPTQRTHYAAIYFDIDSKVLSSKLAAAAVP